MSTSTTHSPVTIVDVARRAGVSHSTVSRVLNGRPYIKAETRRRVMAAAEELGYVANLKARGLAGGRLGVIGFVADSLDGTARTEVVRGVDLALAEAGLELMLCTTQHRERRESSYVSRLSVGLVDGLVVLAPESADRYSRELSARRFPFVLLDHAGSEVASSVIAANRQGSIDAVAHLAELGHRRIAYLPGDVTPELGTERLDGYRDAVAGLALDNDSALVATGDGSPASTRDAVLRLLSLPRPPTAIVAATDPVAVSVLAVLGGEGVDVPGRLSVVGFDDSADASLVAPQLTTVGERRDEMGRRAVALLLDQIEDAERPAAHLQVPTQLVIRRSTGSVPA